mmetsp:Transcript_41975/g.96384  ORF Transcript_41975/g.96384 Transcript_41975/m.96384 type:complete len:202 (-) Transcript_41975:635-1240(-)
MISCDGFQRHHDALDICDDHHATIPCSDATNILINHWLALIEPTCCCTMPTTDVYPLPQHADHCVVASVSVLKYHHQISKHQINQGTNNSKGMGENFLEFPWQQDASIDQKAYSYRQSYRPRIAVNCRMVHHPRYEGHGNQHQTCKSGEGHISSKGSPQCHWGITHCRCPPSSTDIYIDTRARKHMFEHTVNVTVLVIAAG